MKLVEKNITRSELKEMSACMFGGLIRPHQKNFSRGIESPELQKKIREVVSTLVSL